MTDLPQRAKRLAGNLRGVYWMPEARTVDELIAAHNAMYEALAALKQDCADLIPPYYANQIDVAIAKARGET